MPHTVGAAHTHGFNFVAGRDEALLHARIARSVSPFLLKIKLYFERLELLGSNVAVQYPKLKDVSKHLQ
jgi:hypothetical protein